MNLQGKIAVVTGANGAIGGAIVKALTARGVNCIEIDRTTPDGCDFSDIGQVEILGDKIAEKYSKVDYLINVAGIGIYKSLKDLSTKEWLDSFSINVNAPFMLSKKLLPLLKNGEHPMIFNIGSGMGVIGASDRSSYCASKFALRGLSLSLAKELKKDGIDVCLLTLGSVMTPFGTGGIDKRRELEKSGKKYLEVSEVAEKICDIAQSTNREEEYVLYPEGYL